MEKIKHVFDSHIGLVSVAYIILFSGFLTLSVEAIQKPSIKSTLYWAYTNHQAALMGFVIVLTIGLLGLVFSRRVYVAAFLQVALFIPLSVISHLKIDLRSEPLYPWDLFIGRETLMVSENFKFTFSANIIAVIVLTLFLAALAIAIKPISINIKKRLFFLGTIIIFSTCFLQFLVWNSPNQIKIGLITTVWTQNESYYYNGFLTAFATNFKNVIINAPSGYNGTQSVGAVLPKSGTKNTEVKPDIIIVMNESFWDINRLTAVGFDKNITQNFEKIQKEGISGNLLTQQFAGGTANTEFDVLTGHSNQFLPAGSIAYQQYIHKPTESIVSYLKKIGYSTNAFHPFSEWFWNRSNVYPHLGFDKFVSEKDFVGAERKGYFISDSASSDRLLSDYSAHLAATSNPYFGFLVTMQNHSPFIAGRYDNQEDYVVSGPLSPEAQDILEAYATGVDDADKALGKIVEKISNSKRRTILIFFGDHLPGLGVDFQVYREAGYISDGALTPEDKEKLYSSPFVIWSNYKDIREDVGTINDNYLLPLVFEKYGLSMPPYFQLINELRRAVPACNKVVCLVAGKPQKEQPKEYANQLGKQWLLEYDMLFGKNYYSELVTD